MKSKDKLTAEQREEIVQHYRECVRPKTRKFTDADRIREQFHREYPGHPPQCPVKSIRQDGRCKISIDTFASKEDAEAASKWAGIHCILRSRLGYDFGYQCPGNITDNKDGTFDVVMP